SWERWSIAILICSMYTTGTCMTSPPQGIIEPERAFTRSPASTPTTRAYSQQEQIDGQATIARAHHHRLSPRRPFRLSRLSRSDYTVPGYPCCDQFRFYRSVGDWFAHLLLVSGHHGVALSPGAWPRKSWNFAR